MIGLQIDDTKAFMNHLFKEETFDTFELVSLQLKTMVYYEIEGDVIKEYYDTDQQEEVAPISYLKWAYYKSNIAPLLKGKRPPMVLKIVLTLSEDQTIRTLAKIDSNDIQGFFINIVYEHPALKITTGTNYKTFSMDKSGEQYFDESIRKYLNKHHIGYTE